MQSTPERFFKANATERPFEPVTFKAPSNSFFFSKKKLLPLVKAMYKG